jgi:hypothetical protein
MVISTLMHIFDDHSTHLGFIHKFIAILIMAALLQCRQHTNVICEAGKITKNSGTG